MLGVLVRPGQAQQPPLGPTVRALAALPAAERARLVADSLGARVVGVSRDADGVPVAHVFIRLRTPDPGPLLRIGARLGTQTGTLVSARVPLDSLGALLATAGVTAVYGARRWAPVNDVGTSEIGVAGLRSSVAPGEFSGAIGRGVIVGLVDAGVDFTHPDFLAAPAGTSRILYLWDQTLSGPGPGAVGTALFLYGVECRQASLTSATCPSRDSTGHGTHVLGTAAGNGSATGGGHPAGQFAGVAPGADLIVVKSTLFTTAVVDGVNYIFGRAEELGRPAVVNLSLG
jgi:subtilisin family serine protease